MQSRAATHTSSVNFFSVQLIVLSKISEVVKDSYRDHSRLLNDVFNEDIRFTIGTEKNSKFVTFEKAEPQNI